MNIDVYAPSFGQLRCVASMVHVPMCQHNLVYGQLLIGHELHKFVMGVHARVDDHAMPLPFRSVTDPHVAVCLERAGSKTMYLHTNKA